MARTWKLPEIGTSGPQWIQNFLDVVKRMLQPPTFPKANRILVQNGDQGWIDWVPIDSSLLVTTSGVTVSVPTIRWELLYNGDLVNPQVVYSGGDAIMVPRRV